MNFNDVLIENEYRIKQKEPGYIIVEKPHGDVCFIWIVFMKKDNTVMGYIKPNRMYSDIDDMSSLYAAFQEMNKDVKMFSEKFKLKIN